MQRILRYTVADLCADPEGVAAALTHACRQASGPYRVRGLVQVEDQLYVPLLPSQGAPLETYQFAPLLDCTSDEVIALLNERWAAGFDSLASVMAGDGLCLVLLARPEGPA